MVGRVARLRLAAITAVPRTHRSARGAALAPWLVALGAGGILCAAAAVAPGAAVRQLVIVAATCTLLAAAAAGLIAPRDNALDARALRAFGVRWQTAWAGTMLGALLSPLTLVSLLLGIAAMLAGSGALGLVAGALLAITAALARLVADPGAIRDRAPWLGWLGMLGLVVAAVQPFASGIERGVAVLAASPLAAAIGWTMGGSLAVAIVTPLVLAAAWLAICWRRGSTLARDTHPHRLGAFAVLPATSWGAVAARSIATMRRDRRVRSAMIAIVLVPVLLAIPLALAGLPRASWTLLPAAILAVFLGWMPHNDTALDGTAWWQHVAARVPGWADRLGRLVPHALIAVPLVLVASIAAAWSYGNLADLPGVTGGLLAILGAGYGVSSVTSARFPYAVPGPDEHPWTAPTSGSVPSSITQVAALLATAVLSAPVVVPVAMLRIEGAGWSLFAAGLVLGSALAALGIWLGGRIVDRNAPELLAAAMRH